MTEVRNFGCIGVELEAAVGMILNRIDEVQETERLPLLDAWGRVLAETVRAENDNPPFPRSPLDGYSFAASASAGASKEHPVDLQVIDCIYAGQCRKDAVPEGKAVRIMTGAPIPEGCDCVVRLEDVEQIALEVTETAATIETAETPAMTATGEPAETAATTGQNMASGQVRIFTEMRHLQNYCFQGEDFKTGTVLAEPGTVLDAVNLGILASAGRKEVMVRRKLRAALLVTGDEVVMPGEPLKAGKLYGSNLHLLYGRLRELGVNVVSADTVPDEPVQVAERIRALREMGVDTIVTTGGVSVGDKDIFHQVLPLLGAEQVFWRVKMKPGTPAMFACFEEMPMFHLSGNPFAALATFDLLVRPALVKMSGDARLELRCVAAVLADGFAKTSGQRRFIRARYEQGNVRISPAVRHASGILSSMQGCNCLIDVPAGTKSLEPGTPVTVILL